MQALTDEVLTQHQPGTSYRVKLRPHPQFDSPLVDTRSPSQRRHIMQSVGSQNTGPEMTVRSLLHKLGYRYRLHRKELPGTPDIVFPRRRKVIFVHGCFWHGHNCNKGKLPKSRVEFWLEKISRNRERDAAALSELDKLGWHSLVIWQCELRESEKLIERMIEFLES